MVVLAALIGATSAVGGLRAAMMLDTPVGPTIVCAAVGIFAISVVATGLRRLTRG
jgi:zinc transport system permease protein